MSPAQLINQTSGDVQYFTPPEIIEAARATMGGIDLDPASCFEANQIVKAKRFISKEEDGLGCKWSGRVWVNWPFGRKQNPQWVSKILGEWPENNSAMQVEAICCICYACTSEHWFAPLLKRPQCFLSGRTNYRLPGGSIKRGNTKGSVVTYFGRDVASFEYHFRNLGVVKVPL